MNERINELRLEAGIGRLNEVPYMVAVNKEGEIIEALEGLEKFAELIVRECIDTINDVPNGYGDYRNQIEDAMREACVDVVKQKFGVE